MTVLYFNTTALLWLPARRASPTGSGNNVGGSTINPGQLSIVIRHFLMAAVLLFTVAGCGLKDSTDASVDDSEAAVRCHVERGPVQLTVEVSPGKPQLSDEPQLTLTICAQRGVRIEKPPFGEAVGDFLVRDFYEPLPETEDDWETIRQIYQLEPTRSGKLTIAPVTVRFHDERPAGDGEEHTIESESLTVEVSTVLGDEAPSLADLRPAAGPVELPAHGSSAGWWIAVFILAIAVAAVLIRKIIRRRTVREPRLSPQELAWLELNQIVQQKLAESEVKEFYVELTGVVRRYIERSTGVHAPEQTTEEFLREIVDDPVFAGDDQQRLRDFLESADLVKFAAFNPDIADIEASFERAKEFVRLPRVAQQEVAA